MQEHCLLRKKQRLQLSQDDIMQKPLWAAVWE